MTQALEQTALPDTELLHVLLAWCYIHQTELKYHFHEYARRVHDQPSTAYQYAKTHRLYSTKAESRVDYAINMLLEGGDDCIRLHRLNDWQPGRGVLVIGLEEATYETGFSFELDAPGKVWRGCWCGCVDWQPMRLCKHCVIAFYLALAYRELSKGKRAIEHSNLRPI